MHSTTIDIDTGGTFTDGFIVRDREALTVKTLTTPHDLLVCFSAILKQAADQLGCSVADMLAETEAIRYATTVGTNAVLQRRGPKLGTLVGAEATELREGLGRALELFGDEALVRSVDLDADEEATSHEQQPPVIQAVQGLLQDGARGLVCVLPSTGADHSAEIQVRRRFESHYPSHCLDAVPLLLSHEMVDDADDVRRGATALFNAYVHPEVADFLYRAEDHLRDHGYRRPLRVVHNDGRAGRVAKTVAGKTYNSGPTAGLVGAAELARLYGERNLVTLDMGGTSSDVAVIANGEVPLRERGSVDGVEVSLPLVDLMPLGGGGGSIAWIDSAGEVKVGPQSAGASPGPACFGFGGREATTTDADLVLGVIHPDRFLNGGMKVDRELAETALEPIAEQLSVDIPQAALRVCQALDASLGRSLAQLLADHEVDSAEACLLVFGGAGPTHACGIAANAGVTRVLISPFAPVFSAYGVSTTDVECLLEVDAASVGEGELRAQLLRQMVGEGFAADEVAVEIEERGPTRSGRCIKVLPHYQHPSEPSESYQPSPAENRAVIWAAGPPQPTDVYSASDLTPGARLSGPAIVEAGGTTITIPSGWELSVDGHGVYELTAPEGKST